MKVTITAGLLALATKVLAQGVDRPAQAVTADIDHDIICETSDASPYLHHVDQVIDELRNEDDHDVCFNQNVGRKTGLKCGKTIREYSGEDGGAAFQFCKTEKVDGPDGCRRSSPGKVSCYKCDGYGPEAIAFFIETLKNTCKGEHRVGGKIVFKEGGELRVYSMPGYM